MKVLLTCLAGFSLFLFSSVDLFPQAFSWVRMGGNNDGFSCYGRDLVLDSHESVYVTGVLYGDSHFNSLAVNKGGFIVKYDNLGNELWGVSLPDISIQRIALDEPRGLLYVVGYSTRQLSVACYDLNGRQQWLFSGDDRTEGLSVSVDHAGNVYVTGSIATPNGLETNAYISKFDATGTQLWSKEFSWQASQPAWNKYWQGVESTVDSSGNLYVAAGRRWGGVDLFLVKLDSDGIILWEQRATGMLSPKRLAYDGADGIVMQIGISQQANIGDTTFDATTPTGLIVRFDTAGTFIGGVTLKSAYMQLDGLAVNREGTIFAIGHTDGTVKVDPLQVEVSKRRTILASFDRNLTPLRLFTTDTPLEGTAISAGFNQEEVYIAGTSHDTVVAGKIDLAASAVDEYRVHNLSPTILSPNPVSGSAYLTSGQAKIDQVSIYGVDGRPVRTYDHPAFGTRGLEVSFEGLPSGVYYVHLQGPEGTSVVKALKQ